MTSNNVINIKICTWYNKDRRINEHRLECHPDQDTWGLFKSSADLENIADDIAYEVVRHGIISPNYNFILNEGPLPLRKVKKYHDYEGYTAEPPQYIVKKLWSLLKKKTKEYVQKNQALEKKESSL
ncbi:hypothetical protein AYK26_06195 [Euryarchaeota archaeon SM23-78]|nr:MAG: hypothetical protein AYK26_06195 [Euryarchaeota archaeon SM23-78]MBW3001217.1 hypothetical protein [Candidatus Woesearchaeota archaeon]